MKLTQFLLLKLMEECDEVSQRASKQIQFGKFEIQTKQNLTNAERLKLELIDLFAVVKLLQAAGEIPELDDVDLDKAIEEKKQKMQKYLGYSRKLGELPEIIL